MKTLLTFASILGLAAALGTTQAQTPATSHDNPSPARATTPKTADQRAADYKGPKVVKSTKTLGSKMIQESKPTDTVIPTKPKSIK